MPKGFADHNEMRMREGKEDKKKKRMELFSFTLRYRLRTGSNDIVPY